VRNSAIKWLWKVTGRYKLAIASLIFIQTVLGFSSVFFALLLRNAVDNAAQSDKQSFIKNFILLVLLTALQLAFRAVLRHLEELCRSGIENECKGRLFYCLMKKEHSAVSALHSAEWLSRLT
jgi:ABC transporter related protein